MITPEETGIILGRLTIHDEIFLQSLLRAAQNAGEALERDDTGKPGSMGDGDARFTRLSERKGQNRIAGIPLGEGRRCSLNWCPRRDLNRHLRYR